MQRNTEKSRTILRNAEKCKDLVIYKRDGWYGEQIHRMTKTKFGN